MRILKNIFLFLLLIAVIALSFWISFSLGKNLLAPAKKIPTTDFLTMEASPDDVPMFYSKSESRLSAKGGNVGKNVGASVLETIGKITFEVEAVPFKEDYMVPKIKESVKKAKKEIKQIQTVNYQIQLGLFSVKSNAKALVNNLKKLGYEPKLEYIGNKVKVFIPVSALNDANQLAKSIKDKGFEAIVRRK